jgi:hypothetical protein
MNAIFLAILLTATTPPFEVQTLDGQSLVGSLVELTPDRLTIEGSDGRITMETEKVLSISAKQKPSGARYATRVVVELADGSTICGKQYVASGRQATITLTDGDVIEAPTNIVRTVQLQQDSGALATEWNRLIGMKADSDLLMIRKDETIDYHKGVLHDVTEDTVTFDVDGELLPVKRSKVFGFVCRHGDEASFPAVVCRVTDVAGSQWSAQSLTLSERLQWSTATGISVAEPVDQVVQIDFSGGKIAYLSDLKPDSVRWTPFFGVGKPLPSVEQFYAPRYDHNFESAPLQLGGVPYRKGLALHSRTELVYRLPEHFGRFRALVGIDDTVRPGGKVRLAIRGDDKELVNTAIGGGDAPRPIDVDLTGIRRLTILVDFGDGLSTGDYLLLCDARLCK